MHYYEVAPTVIIRADQISFTYSSQLELQIGQIVSISVGKKQLVGTVLASTSKPGYPVKPISEVVEPQPLPLALVQTARWISQYYQTHLALVLQLLLPRGVTKKRRQTNQSTSVASRKRTNIVLTPEQTAAIETILSSTSKTLLLHGVTGSGKTQVYIEAAKRTLGSGKSVIILVPEIALTAQLVAEFSSYFKNIVLTHSRQTESERHQIWRRVLNSTEPQVVIGPRSALFMPLQNLGLVVVDESHEPSYKQEQSPRYSALRVASTLISHHSLAVAVFGSATPSITDYYLADRSQQVISMPRSAQQNRAEPTIEIIDMTNRDHFSGRSFLSTQLIAALEKTMAKGKQALIFHNRRGTATITLCTNCGWQAGCSRCFIPLTLHSDQHLLRCHICGITASVPTSCPTCMNTDIVHKGTGTKRLETELGKIFPRQTIARFDGDTSSSETIDSRYDELYGGDIDIIIGTQVVAKGLDLPNLRTVGIIQADSGLAIPDYAASERTFQLLAQVVGRVGRSHHPTTVIVQSYQPEHPSIVDGVSQNYLEFYQRTLKARQRSNFPPYCYLLKLVCSYKTEPAAIKNSKQLAQDFRRLGPKTIEVLGPTPAFYERLRDSYRWQIVVKSAKRQDLVDLLSLVPSKNWQFELDPTSLL